MGNDYLAPDAAGVNPEKSPLHREALRYAAKDIPVFPCVPGGKEPATEHGFKDATTDAAKIDAWWGAADYNIGMEPESAGWCVVDLDRKNGVDGILEWKTLEGEKPDTFTVATPSGGLHLYYRGSLASTVRKLAPSIDTRGRGGYVLLPPSVADGKEYRILPSIVEGKEYQSSFPPQDWNVAELPSWVTEKINNNDRTPHEAPENVTLDDPATIAWFERVVRDDLATHGAPEEYHGSEKRLYDIVGVARDGDRYGYSLNGDTVLAILHRLWARHFDEDWLQHKTDRTLAPGAYQNKPGCGPAGGRYDHGADETPASWREYVSGLPSGPEPAPGLTIVGQPLPASEDELATGFSKHMADRLRYVDGWGKWFAFDGQRWAPIPTPTVWNKVRDLTRPYILTLDPTKYSDATLRKLLGKATISNVEQLARGTLMETDAAFDADPWSLNTPAGIVDLRTGTLRRADPLAFCTKMTAVAPGGDCQLWRKFLDEVTDGNTALQAYLQRLAGYSLIGEVREHVLVFLYGTGGNGKGVFLGALTGLFDDYAKVAPIDTFTETRSERHPTDMAMLRGARLVTSQETDEGRAWAEAKIKALTGGDKITARFMRQNHFTFTPQFTLLIAGNHKPKLHNVDEAMRRRLHMVPFTTTIGPEKRDPDLPNKLKAEWPGILRWAIEGCLEYQRIGLAAPAAVTNMTASYLEDQDPLAAWFEAWCIEEANAWTSRADLYRNYATHARQGEDEIENATKFYSRLESRGLRQDRGPRPARVRGFVGVSIRPPSDTDIAY